MKYAKHRSSLSRSSHQVPWKWVGTTAIVTVFILAGFWILSDDEDQEVSLEPLEDIAPEQEEEITVSVYEAPEQDSARLYEEIELFAVDHVGSSGIARRGWEDGVYTHVIVATLPSIDSSLYVYEGWLVKPGIVDYFSIGDLFAREDGRWGNVWEVGMLEAPDDLMEYSEVVITLEPRDDDPAPAPHHVLQGAY